MAQLLIIHCPDEPGIIDRITKILFEHGLNIVRNGEFVEHDGNKTVFFG